MRKVADRLRAYFVLTPATFWLVVFFLVPLGIVLFYSFLQKGDYGAIEYVFNVQNYLKIFNPLYGKVFVRSLLLALATEVLCIVLAYPFAYWLAMYGGRKSGFLLFLFVIPSWTSYLVRIYGWMFLLRDTGLVNKLLMKIGLISEPLTLLYNSVAVIIGIVYSYFTFMLLPLYASLSNLDPSVLEAASDLGANPFWRFFKVTLPLTTGGIMAGTILVGVPAIGEFVVPDLLGGAKVTMVGNLIESKFMGTFDWPFGSALAIVLAIIMITAVVLYIRKGGEGALERLV